MIKDFKIMFRKFVWILIGFYLLPISLNAGASNLNFNEEIKRLNSAEKVTVIFHGTPLNMGEDERYEGYNVERLRIGGCNFVSNTSVSVHDMTALLRRNSIKKLTETNHYLPYFGVSIYFSYVDGKETRILLGRRYKGESTLDGELSTGDFRSMSILVDNSAYRDIYNWIAESSKIEANPNYPEIFGGPYLEVRQSFLDNYMRTCTQLMHSNYKQ